MLCRKNDVQKTDKVQRQGLVVTIGELRKLADELEEHISKESGYATKFQINIINKEGLSDTWEIE